MSGREAGEGESLIRLDLQSWGGFQYPSVQKDTDNTIPISDYKEPSLNYNGFIHTKYKDIPETIYIISILYNDCCVNHAYLDLICYCCGICVSSCFF